MKNLNMKVKTGYKIVFWAWVVLTAVSYVWTAYSFLYWLFKVIFL